MLERLEFPSYGFALHEVYQSELPLYVSADVLFQALSVAQDQVLEKLERERLTRVLGETLVSMHTALPEHAAKQGWPAASIQDADLPGMFRHLRRLAARKDAPIVALIAVTTREPWKVLSSCILSLRTQDGTTAPAAMRMFARWPTVDAMAVADPGEVAKAIYPVGFYRTKAPQLVEMARRIRDEWGGRVPDEIDELLKLKGVGRKTANLVVVAGYGKPGICVDTHVHRISNLWGYVKTRTPEETEQALRARLGVGGMVLASGHWPGRGSRHRDHHVALPQRCHRHHRQQPPGSLWLRPARGSLRQRRQNLDRQQLPESGRNQHRQ